MAALRGAKSPQGINAGLACKKSLFESPFFKGLKAAGRVVQVLLDKIEWASRGGKDLGVTVSLCSVRVGFLRVISLSH